MTTALIILAGAVLCVAIGAVVGVALLLRKWRWPG